jgi:DNA-binding HxlR family transcriptional regulator
MEIIHKAKFMEILLTLSKQPMSFNELKKNLNISPTTLSRRISEMEKYGLVVSTISKEEGKKRIKYALTDKGKRIMPLINELISLAIKVTKEIKGE